MNDGLEGWNGAERMLFGHGGRVFSLCRREQYYGGGGQEGYPECCFEYATRACFGKLRKYSSVIILVRNLRSAPWWLVKVGCDDNRMPYSVDSFWSNY